MQNTGRMLEAMTDSMAERIALVSKECTVLWMNKAALEKARQGVAEERGERHCLEAGLCVKGPDGSCDPSCPIDAFHKTGRIETKTRACYDAWEKRSLVDEITVYPVRNEKGEALQLVHVARDRTERTHYEQSLRQTADKLRKLDEMKSDFISIASHELRTPMTAIKSAIDIMVKKKAGETTEAQQRFLGMAERNINRLNSLINDLLSISKIESGKMELNFAEKDLRGIAENAAATLGPLATEKSISLGMNVPAGLPALYVDASKIEQVLLNLVGNAVKFTPNGGRVTIEARRVEGAKDIADDITGFVEISVADTGAGIPEEHVPRLFEKFFQGEASLSKQKQPGSGLGLAISKGIIESHGGKIACTSKAGEGSVFRFTLPVINLDKRFHESLGEELASAREQGSPLSVLIFRMDGYADLLAQLGKKEYERIFESTTEKILQNGIKTKDRMQVSLHKGEITLVLPATDTAGAQVVRERIRQLMAGPDLTEGAQGRRFFFASGSATFPNDGAGAQELVEVAIRRMGQKEA
jgi:signal transduction histidine kinase/GGDEF domain-containing protein